MDSNGDVSMTVREYVAGQTKSLHEALHHDPVLERLTSPNIAPEEYLRALMVLSAFYQGIERNRHTLDSWAEFDLRIECNAMERDLGLRNVEPFDVKVTDPAELLGMLYVAHGASFGRNLFRHNLRRALPEMPLFFVRQLVNKPKWYLLIETMEQQGQKPQYREGLLTGARRGFEAVAGLSAKMGRAEGLV